MGRHYIGGEGRVGSAQIFSVTVLLVDGETNYSPICCQTKCMENRAEKLYIFVRQVKASTPLLMCSVTGYDASGWVDDLAAEQNKQCTSIAIGKKRYR